MEKDSKLHTGHWQRLREKALTNDTAKFTDKEMLELTLQYILIRGDANELASKLLQEFKTFDKVLNASLRDLVKIKGVGQSVAEKITLLPKIINFYNVSNAKSQEYYVSTIEQCVELAKQFLNSLTTERLYMFCINKAGQVTTDIVLGKGEECCVSVPINEVLLRATEYNACSVVFAHNHPNGKTLPSPADLDFTRRATQILYLSGIKVLEHIIIGKSGLYYSFANNLFIQKYVEDVKNLK